MKTGVQAVKLSIAGFIVPFMFIYSPQLLLIDTTFLEGLRVTVGACIGVFMISAAIEGYLFTKIFMPLRLMAFACAFFLIHGGIVTDIVGLAGLALLLGIQHVAARRMERRADAV